MALACWKHRKSAPRIPRMLPVCGVFKAMRCSWRDRSLCINVCSSSVSDRECSTMALPYSAIWVRKHSLLRLPFQHCQAAAAPAGWLLGVETPCVCPLTECSIVHLCGPRVSFQGVWAQEGSCCCWQAAEVEARWVVLQLHPGSNGQHHCCWTGLGNGDTGWQVEAGPLPPHSPSEDIND